MIITGSGCDVHDVFLFVFLSRNGCKPFVEVYVGEERVLTTSQEYELMRYFTRIL